MIFPLLVLDIPWDLLSTCWLVRVYHALNFSYVYEVPFFVLWNYFSCYCSVNYTLYCLWHIPGSRYAVQRSGNVLMSFNNKVCLASLPSYLLFRERLSCLFLLRTLLRKETKELKSSLTISTKFSLLLRGYNSPELKRWSHQVFLWLLSW
jgi:hypothetical protein